MIKDYEKWESLGKKGSYAVALERYGESFLKVLQLRLVASDEVNLTPKLIKLPLH